MSFDEALRHAVYICAAAALGSWLVSLVTKNCSQVDRLWSIMPPIYVTWFAAQAGFEPRSLLMAGLTILWGARLTFNFARKGGYRPGGQDYRWPILRTRMGPALFQLFNFAFIACYQHFLLLAISLPAWWASRHPSPLGALDGAAAALWLAFLIGETVADEQQWRFHEKKRRGETLPEPFLTTGLFRYSRHPNFFCEQAQWFCLYLFSVAASGEWLNPTLVGPALLVLLFQGSTAFTESITLGKYPSYRGYQRTTSRLWPLPNGMRRS